MFKRFDLYLAVFLMVFIIFNTIVLKMRWNGEEEMMDSLLLTKEITVGNIRFNMILVKGGTFIHGEPESDNKWFAKEAPCHNVTLSDFYIGECEVTQALWEEVMGENPSKVKKSDCPADG